jgi:hypothetical protein
MRSKPNQAQVEQRFWRLLRRLSVTMALLVVVTHVFASVGWEHYFARHCEVTGMRDDTARKFTQAWSCDNGKTYFP